MENRFQQNAVRLRRELARQADLAAAEFPPPAPPGSWAWEQLFRAAQGACAEFGGWGGQEFALQMRAELLGGLHFARQAAADPRFPLAERLTTADYLRECLARDRAGCTFCGQPPHWSPRYVLRLLSRILWEEAVRSREEAAAAAMSP